MDTGVRRLVSIPETRQVLGGIGHTTVYELVNRGEIVKVNIGRRGFITSESLEAYIDRLKAASVGVTERDQPSPHMSQQDRDALADLGLIDDDRTGASAPWPSSGRPPRRQVRRRSTMTEKEHRPEEEEFGAATSPGHSADGDDSATGTSLPTGS